FEELLEKRRIFVDEKGEAQNATRSKEAVFDKLDDWMSEFYAIARKPSRIIRNCWNRSQNRLRTNSCKNAGMTDLHQSMIGFFNCYLCVIIILKLL
ncbi:MAG: hypothetical protein ACP5E3_03915, partial [Bacteroidales bacterium]